MNLTNLKNKIINSIDFEYEVTLFTKRIKPKEYISFSIGLTIIITIILAIIDFDLVLLSPFIFYAFYSYAKQQYFKKLGEIERKLPLFLEMLAIEHKIGIPLNTILDGLKQDFPEFVDFKKLYIKYGKYSDYISRAYFLVDSLYKTGKGEEEILEFCDEINQEMELKIKEYNKKLTAMSVILIGTGAVLPGMLQVYYLVGSKFMDVDLTPDQIFFLFVFVFPIINGVLLWIINKKKPRFY